MFLPVSIACDRIVQGQHQSAITNLKAKSSIRVESLPQGFHICAWQWTWITPGPVTHPTESSSRKLLINTCTCSWSWKRRCTFNVSRINAVVCFLRTLLCCHVAAQVWYVTSCCICIFWTRQGNRLIRSWHNGSSRTVWASFCCRSMLWQVCIHHPMVRPMRIGSVWSIWNASLHSLSFCSLSVATLMFISAANNCACFIHIIRLFWITVCCVVKHRWVLCFCSWWCVWHKALPFFATCRNISAVCVLTARLQVTAILILYQYGNTLHTVSSVIQTLKCWCKMAHLTSVPIL